MRPQATLGTVGRRRRIQDAAAHGALLAMVGLSVAALATLLTMLVVQGLPAWTPEFFSNFSSRFPERAGVKASLVGTAWIGGVSLVTALPIGVGAAIYLNEFARPGRVKDLLRTSILNLAGVPSVVFGIMGLALFVRIFGLGNSVLAAALTLALLTLPYIVIVAEEALRAVPQEVRHAAFALGATRWQVVRHHVIPYALPGVLTASILALSRAAGETAPLILIGAASYIAFLPASAFDSFSALPIQVYFWAQDARPAFHTLAWGATLLLVAVTLAGNLAAILLRERAQRRYRW